MSDTPDPPRSPLNALIRFCLEQKLVVAILLAGVLLWGLMVTPFGWDLGGLPRDRVPVDAIPNLGENQQIVFTEWPGRSPQDIDDQITYPLTVALLGVPGVKDIRSYSAFGFSTIYVVFEEDVEFYWSRSRLIEKLNALPAGTLPEAVKPSLGPDATALGQVFWYSLEGVDPDGAIVGGWDPQELRSLQDFTVRYQLASVEGVAEVASIGGFVREYQVDVDPDAMRAAGITLDQVIAAVRQSNLDVGARTLEVNRVEYIVRGLGFIQSVKDLEQTAVTARDGQPILIRDIARVGLGPALRRGVLTREGRETVGGVVVVRFGANPMAVIQRIRDKIDDIASGLPQRTLEDGTVSRVKIVPFYDRTGLIRETLATLSEAITQQVLVTIIVVVLMVMHLRSSLLISAMLPITVLMTFIGMKLVGVDANIVALSGIAIAIGTIVDMGIVLTENILRRLDEAGESDNRLDVIYRASAEVGGAVLTAVATTVVGFLPVFTMQAAEGKLFQPLAWTKTMALIASILIALTILPAAAHLLFGQKAHAQRTLSVLAALTLIAGLFVMTLLNLALGLVLVLLGLFHLIRPWLTAGLTNWSYRIANLIVVLVVLVSLAEAWMPIGPEAGRWGNSLFIAVIVGGLLLLFYLYRIAFPKMLAWCLRHKLIALSPSLLVVLLGVTIWLGFDRVFGWLPQTVRESAPIRQVANAFPGLGSEFMPALDEGSFLYMPTTMPHVSIGEATDILRELDRRIMSVPEVEQAVGKIGRVDSPLDPAPLSMVETIIQYRSEYITDEDGRPKRFRYDRASEAFERDEQDQLIEDDDGRPYRQWRDEIQSPQDIWDAIANAARMPGVTSAPKLQPIETRIVMLQSGFRAPMGIKVYGPDLDTIEAFGLELERILQRVPSIKPESVFADRVVGKPYLEIEIDRERIARYGLHIADVQSVIEVAIGGKPLTMTVEGRERYPVRIRYLRELRDQPDTLGSILVPTPSGVQIPLDQLATIEYRRGPQVIKSEDTFLVSYVLFDRQPDVAEVTVVNDARDHIQEKIDDRSLEVPPGVTYAFGGSYENQVRAARTLAIALPLTLSIIFLLLYFLFRSVAVTLIVFSGVFVAWGGGFLMLWLYAQPWFLNVAPLGIDLRQLFQVQTFNLSVAVWVGFLALFGIAADNGVIMATRIRQSLDETDRGSIDTIRHAVIDGGRLRIRAAVMTSATTILALLPVLTSTGRGSDVMVPMAIPTFGGMAVALLSLFVVPVLYSWVEEIKIRAGT
ncbi:MAG: efflux RND transporter permease subunit [Phycisphaeraceae bacterium]